MTTIHTLVFADEEASWWGACWLAGAEGSAPLAYLVDGTSGVVTVALSANGETEPSELHGEGVSLSFSPSGPPGRGGSAENGIDSFDQLCSVSGRMALGTTEREIDCLGWRARVSGDFDLSDIDTFRQTYGWFDSEDGLGLLALRPRRSRGHDSDLLSATVFEPQPVPRVAEPRLSSTYDAAGIPARVGLELWFESPGTADEAGDEDDRQFPRRAAAETISEAVQWQAVGFWLNAVALRWHSRGSDGTGVYLLGQRG